MKRSSSIALVMISASALALNACDDPKVDAEVYKSLGQCARESQLPNADCREGYLDARRQHAEVAPKFATREECVATFGPNNCEVAPQESSRGGSLFMPIMMGYMIGSGAVHSQPLYRTAHDSRTYRTADNHAVSRSTGHVSVAAAAARAPAAKTAAISRGGFGSRARVAGSASG